MTLHAHTIMPGQFEDLSGHRVIGNVIGKNNLDGDPLDFPPGSTCTPEDLVTTGILVFSGGTPVTVRIAFNHIFNNKIGIWLSKAVTACRAGNQHLHERDHADLGRPLSQVDRLVRSLEQECKSSS